jgi:hypothetical protein
MPQAHANSMWPVPSFGDAENAYIPSRALETFNVSLWEDSLRLAAQLLKWRNQRPSERKFSQPPSLALHSHACYLS